MFLKLALLKCILLRVCFLFIVVFEEDLGRFYWGFFCYCGFWFFGRWWFLVGGGVDRGFIFFFKVCLGLESMSFEVKDFVLLNGIFVLYRGMSMVCFVIGIGSIICFLFVSFQVGFGSWGVGVVCIFYFFYVKFWRYL